MWILAAAEARSAEQDPEPSGQQTEQRIEQQTEQQGDQHAKGKPADELGRHDKQQEHRKPLAEPLPQRDQQVLECLGV